MKLKDVLMAGLVTVMVGGTLPPICHASDEVENRCDPSGDPDEDSCACGGDCKSGGLVYDGCFSKEVRITNPDGFSEYVCGCECGTVDD
ncbi:hypothetical protein CA85_05730 [Allorhodopirellula solitaria]|uniref:Uncharacterized protein n=1 Tax=Allorhodopirellula solitaria TaxID=2527987 RepID=A0A5C5YK47_9BACT|nr:hypothetical protein CA85_05730 [Allorhodopirellula solitaria]